MEVNDKSQQEVQQIEREMAALQASPGQNEEIRRQLLALQERVQKLREEIKPPQTAWQKTELARHPQRPQALDYIERLFTDWSEIHGDRTFGDDPAIICGMLKRYCTGSSDGRKAPQIIPVPALYASLV